MRNTLLLSLVLSSATWAQIRLSNQGVDAGIVNVINCGAGMSCSRSGTRALLTAPGTYTLPAAAAGTLGGIQGCTGASCSGSPALTCGTGYVAYGVSALGVLQCTAQTAAYTLPAAAAGTLGGIQGCTGAGCAGSPALACAGGFVASGIDAAGILQCVAQTAAYTLPAAAASTLGGIKGCTGAGCSGSPALTCAAGYAASGVDAAGILQCTAKTVDTDTNVNNFSLSAYSSVGTLGDNIDFAQYKRPKEGTAKDLRYTVHVASAGLESATLQLYDVTDDGGVCSLSVPCASTVGTTASTTCSTTYRSTNVLAFRWGSNSCAGGVRPLGMATAVIEETDL